MRQKQRVFSLFLLSPSSRRAWIEIPIGVSSLVCCPLSPSSRRAWIEMDTLVLSSLLYAVALLTEGVDRNPQVAAVPTTAAVSPSSRRAWIEMISEDIWRPT